MWLKPTLLIIFIFILFTMSILEVMQRRKKRQMADIPQNPVSSTISQALTYLVGVAGGIYLALILLTSFLGIVFPENIQIWGVAIEPLAFISLFLALAQPWIVKLYYLLIKK